MTVEADTGTNPKKLLNFFQVTKQNILQLVNAINELSGVVKRESRMRPTFTQVVDEL